MLTNRRAAGGRRDPEAGWDNLLGPDPDTKQQPGCEAKDLQRLPMPVNALGVERDAAVAIVQAEES